MVLVYAIAVVFTNVMRLRVALYAMYVSEIGLYVDIRIASFLLFAARSPKEGQSILLDSEQTFGALCSVGVAVQRSALPDAPHLLDAATDLGLLIPAGISKLSIIFSHTGRHSWIIH